MSKVIRFCSVESFSLLLYIPRKDSELGYTIDATLLGLDGPSRCHARAGAALQYAEPIRHMRRRIFGQSQTKSSNVDWVYLIHKSSKGLFLLQSGILQEVAISHAMDSNRRV